MGFYLGHERGGLMVNLWAEKILAWIERHPVAKLMPYVAAVFVFVSVVGGFIDDHFFARERERRQKEEEAKKEGRYFKPRAKMRLDGNDCIVANEDVRPLAEVSLFQESVLIDTKRMKPLYGGGHSRVYPLKWAHDLPPRESLRASLPVLPDGEWCKPHWFADDGDPCQEKGRCVHVVVCKAEVHRPTDMAPFVVSHYAFIGEDCSLRDADNFIEHKLINDEVVTSWTDNEHSQIFAAAKEHWERFGVLENFKERIEMTQVDEEKRLGP